MLHSRSARVAGNVDAARQERVENSGYRDGDNQLTFELVAVYTVESSPQGKLVITNVDFVK